MLRYLSDNVCLVWFLALRWRQMTWEAHVFWRFRVDSTQFNSTQLNSFHLISAQGLLGNWLFHRRLTGWLSGCLFVEWVNMCVHLLKSNRHSFIIVHQTHLLNTIVLFVLSFSRFFIYFYISFFFLLLFFIFYEQRSFTAKARTNWRIGNKT